MSDTKRQVIFLELNELNFDFIRDYVSLGKLPNFAHCLEQGSFSETKSENNYEELEPWIQWITAHTGKSLAEHGVFRLGDIVRHDIPQIWERLEEEGISVGAISPMNAKNRTRAADFFLPDPWTDTPVTGSAIARNLSKAVSQVVNDNAKSKITTKSLVWLAVGAAVYARLSNYMQYLKLAASSRKFPWRKAMILDLLLADMMVKLTRSKKSQFVSLFLNAAAHIQHHYLYSSAVYSGDKSNPEWYVANGVDPVLEVYSLYDRIIGSCRTAFPDARLMIGSGLHQDPHDAVTYYWRLADHRAFLTKHQLPFKAVEVRMSRDFLITCESPEDAAFIERYLGSMRDSTKAALFEVDNRGDDLFVMLTYAADIPDNFRYFADGVEFTGFRDDVAFVAIKNGKHNGIGYFLDMGAKPHDYEDTFPLSQIPDIVMKAFS